MATPSIVSAQSTTLRAATDKDIPEINQIFAHYILNTFISFKTSPDTDTEALANLHAVQREGLPFIVAVASAASPSQSGTASSTATYANPLDTSGDDKQEIVLGYIHGSPYSGTHFAYTHTITFSLYCHPSHTKGGLGRQLLGTFLETLRNPAQHARLLPSCSAATVQREHPIKQVLSIMWLDDRGSNAWLKKWYEGFGFRFVGKLERVGWKGGRWLDVAILQLELW